ncbi:dolichyl-phosphate-mannose-protein mannosyltransferase family protein [Asticcacaulis biprosthecium C19]|uniref:Polyprenol-phosphate-mannose--protein mannosyltransferase n=1 Tax=Asticcacaulis biprosthecium C19 TaxID=715226 RepID=F4QNE9_9CAUL|nr:phospholipid carrier-dependent glycosyltransferase [Asticcacaulis biprosthecium]EGF90857.1 dolichyl-phosphate-mannose-protein mannosyltransferase family protein [Asticcacaulis biprosthecium C19]
MPPILASVVSRTKAIANKLWNADDQTLRWILGALILILACFNFLRDINTPSNAFWDESYYVTAAERYKEDKAQFASHPPLGFMFMDLGQSLDRSNDKVDTHFLGEVKKLDTRVIPKGYDFNAIRMPSAIFAVIGALLFYLIALRLTKEAFEAFVFSLLFVFENSFIVHFRAAHLDSYQLTFTLGAVLVWLTTFGKDPKRPLLAFAAFGILCGLSFMTKVNSLVMVLLCGITLVRSLWTERTRENLLRSLARGSVAAGGFLATVAAIFALHVVLNPNPPEAGTKAGDRDLRAMSQTYKDWLEDKRPLDLAVLWHGSYDYYKYMKGDFTGSILSEPNGSQPILWPFMHKIINYRWDFDGKRTAYTQMVGNPVNWGLGVIGIVGAASLIIARRARRIGDDGHVEDFNRLEGIFAMFMIFWLFHIYLGTQRVMYVYHYFIGLALSFMLVSLVFKIVARKVAFLDKHRFVVLCGISVLIAASYLFYAPLTYHQLLSRGACELRNWPVKMVVCQPMKKRPSEEATSL